MLLSVVLKQQALGELRDLRLVERIGAALFDFGLVRIALHAKSRQHSDEDEELVGIALNGFHLLNLLSLRHDDMASVKQPRLHRIDDFGNGHAVAPACSFLGIGADVLRGREHTLVMTHTHHIPKADLYAFLMKSNGEVRCVAVIVKVGQTDVCEHPAEDMSFNGSLAELLLYLRKQHHAWSVAVFVLCSEEVVNLYVVVLLVAEGDELLQEGVVVNAFQGLAIHIVLFVSAL